MAAARTSSIDVDERLERIIGTPARADARAVASSPSGWAMHWRAVGATQTGIAASRPITRVREVRCETSRITRYQSLRRSHAARFSRRVVSAQAPLR